MAFPWRIVVFTNSSKSFLPATSACKDCSPPLNFGNIITSDVKVEVIVLSFTNIPLCMVLGVHNLIICCSPRSSIIRAERIYD